MRPGVTDGKSLEAKYGNEPAKKKHSHYFLSHSPRVHDDQRVKLSRFRLLVFLALGVKTKT